MKILHKAGLGLLFILFITSHLFSQEKSQVIDELINKYYEYGQFNGSILVSENGKVILSKGYGYADMEWDISNTPDTKFRLASVTKQFTAMLIMQLAEEGKIDLNGKITDYLQDYRKETGDKISIKNLLTHTSGIPDYTDNTVLMKKIAANPISVKDQIEKLCSNDLEFEPGSQYKYSNSGYVLLGAVIEKITGKNYEEVLSEKILIPTGMTNSGYDDNKKVIKNRASGYDKTLDGYVNSKYIDMSIPYSAGSMYSTVNDMYKWNQTLYTDKLLPKESIEKMFVPYLKDYGYGWHITEVEFGDAKKKLVTHSGGIFGFNTIILRYTDDKNCIIILNNFSSGNIKEMGKNISNILYDQKYDLPKISLIDILYKTYTEKSMTEAVEEFKSHMNNKNDYSYREGDLNNLGYSLLQTGKIDDAIEVFRLNTEAFPNSGNTYDSLGEAYLEKGNKEMAIQSYKKSVELKSLKLYIWSYRDEGVFHEAVTNKILDDLVAAIKPRYIRLIARFYVRGGIFTNVTVDYRKKGWQQKSTVLLQEFNSQFNIRE